MIKMNNRRAAIRRDKREREKILKSKAPGADMLRIKNEGWEELKELRVAYYKGFKEGKIIGYNKAIDDLLKDANETSIEVDTGTYTIKAIGIGLLEQIAEQLKDGKKMKRMDQED